jgi:hypothetical protein
VSAPLSRELGRILGSHAVSTPERQLIVDAFGALPPTGQMTDLPESVQILVQEIDKRPTDNETLAKSK